MNNNTFEKLQYEDLKNKIKKLCVSELGRKLIDNISPSKDIRVVERKLCETSEGVKILDIMNSVPLYGVSNISDFIDKIDKGIILEAESVSLIGDFLRGCRKLKTIMSDKESYAPMLYSYSLSISECVEIEEEISRSISGSKVSSEASKELKKIRRQMESCEDKINERLKKFLSNPSNKESIQEFFISKRNDRFTVPIKASYKNRVEGTLIEISSKGSTVFIEPSSIQKYVTELNVLRAEEAVEEYKILAHINNLIYEKLKEIKLNVEVIAQFDMIFAKAKYSKRIGGIKPKLNTRGHIKIVNGKHPLIEGEVVPLNFEVGDSYRSLVITGPNAGGKTIVLKTVGLLTLAVQSGFHISADEETHINIFNSVYVDIGDNQSIENSLSTFSSHMKNLAQIVRDVDNRTLVICDEIGSGTEPNEGAGIAIAVLEEFYKKGAITIATTHYGEIKRFSENHDDFENAAMMFKKETLEPLYKLLIGKSGHSNALWISEKMGLSKHLVERAREYIENKDYSYDKVKESKVRKVTQDEVQDIYEEKNYEYGKGDRVNLLDFNGYAIIYEPENKLNNITVFYNGEFKEINKARVKLNLKASELYPEGYDLNTLFTSYKERKMEHDIERGSKKALKKIQKEIHSKDNNTK